MREMTGAFVAPITAKLVLGFNEERRSVTMPRDRLSRIGRPLGRVVITGSATAGGALMWLAGTLPAQAHMLESSGAGWLHDFGHRLAGADHLMAMLGVAVVATSMTLIGLLGITMVRTLRARRGRTLAARALPRSRSSA
jgi:hypothetical protein